MSDIKIVRGIIATNLENKLQSIKSDLKHGKIGAHKYQLALDSHENFASIQKAFEADISNLKDAIETIERNKSTLSKLQGRGVKGFINNFISNRATAKLIKIVDAELKILKAHAKATNEVFDEFKTKMSAVEKLLNEKENLEDKLGRAKRVSAKLDKIDRALDRLTRAKETMSRRNSLQEKLDSLGVKQQTLNQIIVSAKSPDDVKEAQDKLNRVKQKMESINIKLVDSEQRLIKDEKRLRKEKTKLQAFMPKNLEAKAKRLKEVVKELSEVMPIKTKRVKTERTRFERYALKVNKDLKKLGQEYERTKKMAITYREFAKNDERILILDDQIAKSKTDEARHRATEERKSILQSHNKKIRNFSEKLQNIKQAIKDGITILQGKEPTLYEIQEWRERIKKYVE